MRAALPLALLVLAASCAGGSDERCASRADCAAGEACVDGTCVPAGDSGTSLVDAGLRCTDSDGDFYGDGPGCRGVDCDDANAAVSPEGVEACNGADDDCDGATDEDIADVTCGDGVCARTAPGCIGGTVPACTPGDPSSERCNTIDDDCDTRVDEGAGDAFDGDALQPEWMNGAVGTALSPVVSGGFFRLSDAPYASTPSSPTHSWIYEPDVDRGNQITQPILVHGRDFHLVVTMDWSSNAPELTLAGVALTSDTSLLELMAGYTDGSSADTGNPFARVRQAGTDASFSGARASAGAGTIEVERTSGMITVRHDGTETLVAPLTADLTGLAIFAVAHRSGASTYPFGEWGLDRVQLCY